MGLTNRPRSPLLYGIIILFVVSVTSIGVLFSLGRQIQHRINAFGAQNHVEKLDRSLMEWTIYNLLSEVSDAPVDSEVKRTLEEKISSLGGLLENAVVSDPSQLKRSVDLKNAWGTFIGNIHDEGSRRRLKALIDEIEFYEQSKIDTYSPNIDNGIKVMIFVSITLLIVSGALVFHALRNQKREAQKQKELIDRLEEARMASESSSQLKSKFVATVSHEIRTPINGIVGAAELIRNSELDAKNKKLVGLIYNSSQTLLNLVNGLLDFSRLESSEPSLNPVNVDLHNLIAEVVESMSWKADSKTVNLSYDIGKGVPNCVSIDPTLLKQVLVNLIGNGLKFTDHGSVKVKVRKGSEGIKFSIDDTGIGIPKKALSKLFTPFFQVKSVGISAEPGTGLGLAISQRLVQALGGQIEVESEVDRGSQFFFTLKLAEVSTRDYKNSTETPHAADKALENILILLVEDNETNQIVCAEMIKEHGGTCIVASHGGEALNMLASNPKIDIILMDCQMPIMDGYEAAQRIRAVGKKLPILALTANATDENQRLCFEAGMNGFMVKPISQSDLISKVNAHLKKNLKTSENYDLGHQVGENIKKKVVHSYLKMLEELFDILHKSDLDLENLKKLGHKYKSSSKMVGEDDFSNLCQKLENASSKKEAEKIVSVIEENIPKIQKKLNLSIAANS